MGRGIPQSGTFEKCVHYDVRKLRQISEAVGREDHRPFPSSFVESREKFWGLCAADR
jgi:hypothetical protein